MADIENIIKTDTSMNILVRKLSRMSDKVVPLIEVEMVKAQQIVQ
jgi:hypothetical protein